MNKIPTLSTTTHYFVDISPKTGGDTLVNIFHSNYVDVVFENAQQQTLIL